MQFALGRDYKLTPSGYASTTSAMAITTESAASHMNSMNSRSYHLIEIWLGSSIRETDGSVSIYLQKELPKLEGTIIEQ